MWIWKHAFQQKPNVCIWSERLILINEVKAPPYCSFQLVSGQWTTWCSSILTGFTWMLWWYPKWQKGCIRTRCLSIGRFVIQVCCHSLAITRLYLHILRCFFPSRRTSQCCFPVVDMSIETLHFMYLATVVFPCLSPSNLIMLDHSTSLFGNGTF